MNFQAIAASCLAGVRHVMVAIARSMLRIAGSTSLVVRHAPRGVRLRVGSGVTVTGVAHIRCADGVSVGDGAELLGVAGVQPEGVSIHLGKAVRISKRCQLAPLHGMSIDIGAYSSLHNNTYLLGSIDIGRYCLLSANIFISSGDHYAFKTPGMLIRDQDRKYSALPEHGRAAVLIEDDCWIGWGAAIKNGVTLGKGAVVGANAVVTHDVAPYAVVGGQPARVLRNRILFEPPDRIDVVDSSSWPYLYRGFMLSDEERAAFKRAGGIGVRPAALLVVTRRDFSWCELRGASLTDDLELDVQWSDCLPVRITLPRGPFKQRFVMAQLSTPGGVPDKGAAVLDDVHAFGIRDVALDGFDLGDTAPRWLFLSFQLSPLADGDGS